MAGAKNEQKREKKSAGTYEVPGYKVYILRASHPNSAMGTYLLHILLIYAIDTKKGQQTSSE
jgi:hypothetical protein